MSDLVSRKELKESFKSFYKGVGHYGIAESIIDNAPDVKAKPTTCTCRDCVFAYFNTSNETYKCRSMRGMYRTVEAEEYCSWGEALLDE